VTVLLVHPTHQRRGVGRRLVAAALSHLAREGLVPVAVECLSANIPARRLYEALGGRAVGEHRVADGGTLRPSTVYGWTADEVTHLLHGAAGPPGPGRAST
jgi:RimJ/RimL family protein N-acetyltransferase